ncbi:MAG: glycosyltransferase family 2 protein [Gemmatimonadota bacterium]
MDPDPVTVDEPTFTVVVPTYNRPELVRQCAEAIVDLDYPRTRYELIVVDDGGSTPLGPILEPLRDRGTVRLIEQANEGPASARNLGVEQAEGSLIAFTDDDCRPTADWLRRLAARLAGATGTLVGGRTVNALTGNPYAEASQQLIDYLYEYYEGGAAGQFFTSNNMGVHRDALRSVGSFDVTELRATAEDRELCDRWQHHGLQLLYAPEVVVRHSHEMNLRGFLRQHFNYGRGALYYHERRAERGSGRIKLEPPSFYTGLLRHPLETGRGTSELRQTFLMGLSQVANAAGYFRERFLGNS